MVQFVFTARVAGKSGQVLAGVRAKSAALAPLIAILVIASGAVPTFESVNESGALVVVMGTPPNGAAVVDRLTTGTVPVPFSVAFWRMKGMAPPWLSVNVTTPVRA